MDEIKVGVYPQDCAFEKKPIDWFILDKKNGSALLLSKYGLDCKKYNETEEETNWEKCSLRKWLNDDFYQKAFNDLEKKRIHTTDILTLPHPNFDTYQGEKTKDNVFILSIQEAENYLSNKKEAACFPTYYSEKNGSIVNDPSKTVGFPIDDQIIGAGQWWLRTVTGMHPSKSHLGCIRGMRDDRDIPDSTFASIMTSLPAISVCNFRVNEGLTTVRPCIWYRI